MIPRKYKVWWPEQGQTKDAARVFEGFDHEHAAAEWAEWYDHHSADYQIVGGTAAEVQVLREDEVAASAVLVTGQLSRTYSGHALTANDRVEGRDAALSRRVPSHDGLGGAVSPAPTFKGEDDGH